MAAPSGHTLLTVEASTARLHHTSLYAAGPSTALARFLIVAIDISSGGAGTAEGSKGSKGDQSEGGAQGGGPEDHQGRHPEAHDEEQKGAQVIGQNRLSVSQRGLGCLLAQVWRRLVSAWEQSASSCVGVVWEDV